MNRSSGRPLTAVAVMAIAVQAWPGSAAAAGTAKARAFAAQAAVSGSEGMMPLLAAMAIGIAVSVIAVLAFLQMTSKGKGTKDDEFKHPDFAYDPSILNHIQSSDGQRAKAPEADAADQASGADEPDDIADDPIGYTIPLRSLGSSASGPNNRRPEPAVGGEPRLVCLKGEFAGGSYRLSDRPVVIGRDGAQCGLVYPEGHGEISRRHCTVGYDPSRRVFTLVDHGSSNGTYLMDGTRIAAGDRRELRSGERFALSGDSQWFEVQG
ncbi:FHA domain-containing protein [Cohnella sp. 56]|uniref:FHA domain-containing protein n=1 Tax=Cohnella sp. 56 TaxID=3113722 RepID=UPI0030E9ADA6